MDLGDAVIAVVRELDAPRRRVLGALLFEPQHSASAGQLKTLLGYSAVVQVNAVMGHIGRKVREALGAHPEGLRDGEYEWWHVIATGEHVKGRGFVWTLRRDVVSALSASGLFASGVSAPEEIDGDSQKFIEGAVCRVLVNAYERNPVARERCIEVHGYKCVVCGFDFGSAYGVEMSGYVHVHHLKPLASIGERYEVDPIEDLRPVCANCHAVIHAVYPARTIEQVRAMVYENKT